MKYLKYFKSKHPPPVVFQIFQLSNILNVIFSLCKFDKHFTKGKYFKYKISPMMIPHCDFLIVHSLTNTLQMANISNNSNISNIKYSQWWFLIVIFLLCNSDKHFANGKRANMHSVLLHQHMFLLLLQKKSLWWFWSCENDKSER